MDRRIRIRIHPKMSWISNTDNNNNNYEEYSGPERALFNVMPMGRSPRCTIQPGTLWASKNALQISTIYYCVADELPVFPRILYSEPIFPWIDDKVEPRLLHRQPYAIGTNLTNHLSSLANPLPT
jgi:hypothetical protein